MAKKIVQRTYEESVAWLRDHGFEILEVPATPNRVFVKKHACSAAIELDPETGGPRLFAKPGYLVGGEIARPIDKGYQKFLKTSKLETPATAEHLKAIQQFSEELREGMAVPSPSNESLCNETTRYRC